MRRGALCARGACGIRTLLDAKRVLLLGLTFIHLSDAETAGQIELRIRRVMLTCCPSHLSYLSAQMIHIYMALYLCATPRPLFKVKVEDDLSRRGR